MRPIRAEYQTSASPSFLPEIKKASKKIESPIMAPAIGSQAGSCSFNSSLRIKKKGKAKINAARGTLPVFISVAAMATEKRTNSDFHNMSDITD